MENTIEELKKIRKEIWNQLHIAEEWKKKDEVMALLDKAIEILKEK